MALPRRALLMSAAAAAIAGLGARAAAEGACRPGDATASNEPDMTIGAAHAPLALIGYLSSTCPHCAEFHRETWPRLKANYIDKGLVRFTLREIATAPGVVAVAEFQLARCRCASPEQYMTRLDTLFDQQQAILETGTMEGVLHALIAIGAQYGLSEADLETCLNDTAGGDRVRRSLTDAQSTFDVQGTPTFILDGEKIEDPAFATYEGMSRILDARLAQRHRG